MINKTLVSLTIFGFLMNGCVSGLSNQMKVQNKNLEQKQMPTRLYKTSSTKDADFYKSDWAGKAGNSIAIHSKVVYTDIYNAFKKNCGFNPNDLIQTRIVSHKHPIYYEVWVFNDELSKRKDKTSALSVILTQLPNGGGVDINFKGKCHSDMPLQFIVSK